MRRTAADYRSDDRYIAPGNPDAIRLRQQLDHPIRTNQANTPEHMADVEEVIRLLDSIEPLAARSFKRGPRQLA